MLCQGRLPKKGNPFPLFERKPPPPRAVYGGESAFTYIVVFFSKNFPIFKKIFRFFQKFFRSAPPRPPRTSFKRRSRSSAALVQAPSPYRYVFFVENQRASRKFFVFLKKFSEEPFWTRAPRCPKQRDARFSCKFLPFKSAIQETAFTVHF